MMKRERKLQIMEAVRCKKRFNSLTIIGISDTQGQAGRLLLECVCDCGNIKLADFWGLEHGAFTSCGCVHKEFSRKRMKGIRADPTTHNMSSIPEYFIWSCMKARCYRKENANFKWYGGRGITVCDRWLESFEHFFADMGKRPAPEMSIDRIDPDGNYEPTNCKWSTQKEQVNNRSKKKIA
jgi:hypothetical protein